MILFLYPTRIGFVAKCYMLYQQRDQIPCSLVNFLVLEAKAPPAEKCGVGTNENYKQSPMHTLSPSSAHSKKLKHRVANTTREPHLDLMQVEPQSIP